ncbi:MAG: UDP-2,3-diacylglucosamine diphosphatase [Gammaproteobacteria bacterium]|nr:UDP-2,3-diacylglucosamine diphosphatase [Gammaproteobacteria bacterium]
MTALFVSDIHLDFDHEVRLRALDQVLNSALREDAEIYILGDLVEVWVGDDDDSAFADTLREMLGKYGERTALYLMHGNRDFLFGPQFASEVNAKMLDDPSIIELGNQRHLLSHGDAFCTSDTDYQQMRRLFRSKEFQQNFLSQDLATRRDFAQNVRAQSQKSNANKPEQITDVVEDEVRKALERHDCCTAIHGHTHRPGMHDMGEGLSRYVLGSWERCGWPGWFRDEFTLQCFSIEGAPL